MRQPEAMDKVAPAASHAGGSTDERRDLLDIVLDRLAAIEVGTLMVALGVLIGAFVRAYYVLTADFPLNDGGLFFQMTRDLQAAQFRLPATTLYNFADIPFAYAPLGFYAAGLLELVTPLTLVDIFRFLPLTVSCLMVGAFALLARDLVPSRIAVVIAVFAFALVPRTFIWMIMGGGVTRSFGLLFAIMALHFVVVMYREAGWRPMLLATLCCALTVLSHLQTGAFLVFSIALFFTAFCRSRRSAATSVIVAAGTVVLTAPWWGTVIATHGVAPFIAANATGGTFFTESTVRGYLISSLLSLATTSEPLFPLIAMLALLGMIASITSGRFLLPAWWVAIILLDARAFQTYSTIPLAMLAGIGWAEVVLPVTLRPLRKRWAEAAPAAGEPQIGGVSLSFAMRSWAPIVLGVFLWYATNGALMRAGETPALASVSTNERTALAWVAEETPLDARFLVVSAESWPTDRSSEWFPVLAQRVSVSTVQGYEWFPGGVFEQRIWVHGLAQGCSDVDADCIVQWRDITGISYDYVFIPKSPYWQCCEHMVQTLRADPRFRAVYNGSGATIYRYVGRHAAVQTPQTRERNQSTVRAMPSLSAMRGSQPQTSRACEASSQMRWMSPGRSSA